MARLDETSKEKLRDYWKKSKLDMKKTSQTPVKSDDDLKNQANRQEKRRHGLSLSRRAYARKGSDPDTGRDLTDRQIKNRLKDNPIQKPRITKEETERLNELSKETLADYVRGAAGDAMSAAVAVNHHGPRHAESQRRIKNRMKGLYRASKRLEGKTGDDKKYKTEETEMPSLQEAVIAGIDGKLDQMRTIIHRELNERAVTALDEIKVVLAGMLFKEDAEQIDELSKNVLKSYVKKAAPATAGSMGSHFGKAPSEIKKSNKRSTGVLKAVRKLAKEEVEKSELPLVVELSPGLLGRYVKKASHDVSQRQYKQGYSDSAISSHEVDSHSPDDLAKRAAAKKSSDRSNLRSVRNRSAGIVKAVNKLSGHVGPDTAHKGMRVPREAGGNKFGKSPHEKARGTAFKDTTTPEQKKKYGKYAHIGAKLERGVGPDGKLKLKNTFEETTPSKDLQQSIIKSSRSKKVDLKNKEKFNAAKAKTKGKKDTGEASDWQDNKTDGTFKKNRHVAYVSGALKKAT